MPTVSVSWPRNSAAVLGLGALLSTACGESDHRLGGATCGGGAELVLIDDMEDDNKAAIMNTSGRAGTWYAYNDTTGQQEPTTLVDVFPMAELEPKRGSSEWAAHTSGSGFSDWGAGIACDLNLKSFYDASRYSGISFWIRSQNDALYSVRVQVSDKYTSPRGGVCDEPSFECNDDFGANVTPGEEWQQVRLHWAELKQGGFAPSRLSHIDSSAIYAIKFQTQAGNDFDFFVDDVAFLCTDPLAE